MRFIYRFSLLACLVLFASGATAQEPSQQAAAYIGTWHHVGPACASPGIPNAVTISFTEHKDGVFGGQIWTTCQDQNSRFTTAGNDVVAARLQPDGSVIVSIGDQFDYVLRHAGPNQLKGDFHTKATGASQSIILDKEH